jgi:hypothetical protein
VNALQIKKRLMKHTAATPEAARTIQPDYRPTYRESGYRRPLMFRLTSLTRFMLGLGMLVLLGVGILAMNHVIDTSNGTERLSDRMPMQYEVIIYDLFTPTPTRRVRPTAAPRPTVESIIAPAVDPSTAPWVKQLTVQADGTLMAPRDVVAKAAADIGAYYTIQRDMSLSEHETRHAEIEATYFAGRALEYMRGLEAGQTSYEMNRAGRFSVEIRRFSADGLSATAGIIRRDWVSDVYDRATKELLARGKSSNDSLTLSTIVYDQASGRWKFASIDEVMELTP